MGSINIKLQHVQISEIVKYPVVIRQVKNTRFQVNYDNTQELISFFFILG